MATIMQNWYAVYVKSRHEFVTRGELVRKDVETFLPVVTKVRQWKDRRKSIDFPLFPGYLFVHIEPRSDAFLSVLKVRGALSLLSLEPGFPTPVPTEEINSLRLLVEKGDEIDVYPHLKEGTRVRVTRGPLTGAEGRLDRKDGVCTFLVNIELLGRSIGVRIHGDDVEAV